MFYVSEIVVRVVIGQIEFKIYDFINLVLVNFY